MVIISIDKIKSAETYDFTVKVTVLVILTHFIEICCLFFGKVRSYNVMIYAHI